MDRLACDAPRATPCRLDASCASWRSPTTRGAGRIREIDGGRDRRHQGGGAGRGAHGRHAGPRSAAAPGVVIDSGGLVLTIGYLILEATSVDLYAADGKRIPAEIVAYDHETGFGLVRATLPLGATPLPARPQQRRARSAIRCSCSAATARLGGREAKLASRREFAGYWEYLLPDALFTTPPHADFAGAALIDREDRLVGIGSLLVRRRHGRGRGIARQHVRAHRRAAADPGRSPGARPPRRAGPSLGRRLGPGACRAADRAQPVADGGPAASAGVRARRRHRRRGRRRRWARWPSSIAACGSWAPGVTVPLADSCATDRVIELSVPSIDRMRWLRLNQTY